MRAFFDAVDAGQHDPILFMLGALLIAFAVVEWLLARSRRS